MEGKLAVTYAFIKKPFQKPAEVIGSVNEDTLRQLDEQSLPIDTPLDWHIRSGFKTYNVFSVGEHLTAVNIVTKGEDDEFGRPNLVSHILVFDSSNDRTNPIALLHHVDRLASKNRLPLVQEIKGIIDELSKSYDTEAWADTRKALLANYPESFLGASLYCIANSNTTYIIYSRPETLLDFVGFIYMSIGFDNSRSVSFESLCGSGFKTESAARFRGIQITKNELNIKKEAKAVIKSQKACIIDLLNKEITPKPKDDTTYILLAREVLGVSWFGIPKSSQIRIIHDIARGGLSRFSEMKGLDSNLDRVLVDIERVEKLMKSFKK